MITDSLSHRFTVLPAARGAFRAIGRDKPSESRRSVSQLTPAEERLEALYGRRSPKELNLGKDAQTQLVTV